MRFPVDRVILSFLFVMLSAPCINAATADDPPAWLQQASAIKLPTYDKDVSAVVLVDDLTTTLEPDGRLTEVYNFAVRVLRREGRSYASAHCGYNPEVGKVKDFRAWLIRPGGDIKKYGKDAVVDIVADVNDVYNEYRVQRIVADDDADAGSVFAYTYTRNERSVFSQTTWFFQSDTPVVNSRLTLNLPQGWRAEGITFNHSKVEPKVNGSTYSWEMNDLPPIPDEPFSPSIRNLAARLAVSYYPPATGQPLPVKTFSNWGDVAAWMAELADPQVQVNDALARKAYELVALAKTEFEKIQAIAQYVQKIQYISIQTDTGRGGGYRPHSSTEVFAKSYGDCKDKANLMRAMLKVVGITSIPVSIYSGDPNYVQPNWASPIQFNHCIIAVKISEQTTASTVIQHPALGRLLIFDPTDSETLLGDLPFYLQGSFALIDSNEAPELVKMPVTPPEMNQLQRNASFQLNADGSITGKVSEEAHGQTAARYRTEYRRMPKAEYNGMIERWVTTGASAARLSKIEPGDNSDQGHFTLNVEFSAPAYGQLMQGRLLVFKPAVISRREGLTLTANQRKHPVVLSGNAYSEVVKIQLPAEFSVDELPDAVKLETTFGSYVTSYEVKDRELVFKRQLSLRAAVIPASEYSVVKKFFESIRTAENAPVVLARN